MDGSGWMEVGGLKLQMGEHFKSRHSVVRISFS